MPRRQRRPLRVPRRRRRHRREWRQYRVTAPPAPIAATVAPPAEPRSALTDDLQSVLGREGKLPGLELGASTRGLVISLPEAGSFPPGQADLSPRAQAVMRDLATTLRHYPNQIRVEGHTDDIPIHTPRFASNWELSTARATRVVQFLIDEGGLDPVRLAAAGYGEFRPRVPNTTAEARARNRRVDIVVLDPGAATREDPEGGQP